MKTVAPHLPAPVCSVTAHKNNLVFKWFVATVSVAFLAAIVAASLMIERWYPTGINASVLVSNRGYAPTLDAGLVRDWRSRLITIIDESKISGGYYTAGSRLVGAVIVNSGGWVVAPLTPLPAKQNLIGLDYQGHRLTVQEIISDEARKLMFLKLTGADFQSTATFANRSALQTGRTIWGLGEDWQPYTIGQKIIRREQTFSAALDTILYPIQESGAEFRILMSDRGELIGFSDANRSIIPVWMVTNLLARVSLAKTPALRFDWRGNFVDSKQVGQENIPARGFLLTEIIRHDLNLESLIKKGDVLQKVQNQDVTRDNLAELIMTAPDDFLVTVLRGDKIINLNINK